MAIRGQSRDLCGSFNLLDDLSRHFMHDGTLRQDIARTCSPVFDSKDNYCTTPESFNMHIIFDQIQNYQRTKPTSSLDHMQCYSPQLHPLHSLKTNFPTTTFSPPYSSSIQSKLAKDIVSSAPYLTGSTIIPENLLRPMQNKSQICLYGEDSSSTCQNSVFNKTAEIGSCSKRDILVNENSSLHNTQVELTNNNFWADLQLRWEALAKTDLESHPWLVHHEETEHELIYQFSVHRAHVQGDLMKQGISLLSQGQLTLAIGTFEAELQARPENSQAWLYLGSSQAENEQDELSISALRKCISLDPQNMDARLLLAVGYTNESKNRHACKILHEWLLYHPSFHTLFPSETPNAPDQHFMPSFLDPKFHEDVVDLFEQALLSSLGNSQEKGDLHVAAGILYHLAEQYSVSVRHFKIALSLQSDNPMLWNKLGATLANGDRSEEAVHAYKEALRLYPNYVRCRYNMGIACMNLKSFPEACEHFLIALKLQSQGRGPSATAWNLWNTLRLAIMLGDMSHLFPNVDNRDLDSLLVEFRLCD